LQAHVRAASDCAETTGKALHVALRIAAARMLAPGEREPHKDDVTKLVDALGGTHSYWAELATPFVQFLDQLVESSDEASARFAARARQVAVSALTNTCASAGTSARHLQALAAAESYLAREISKSETA